MGGPKRSARGQVVVLSVVMSALFGIACSDDPGRTNASKPPSEVRVGLSPSSTVTTTPFANEPTDEPATSPASGEDLAGSPSGGSSPGSNGGPAGGGATSPARTVVSRRQAPETASVRRTAPFDYGCLRQAPCETQDESTRDGNLTSVAYPQPPCRTTYVFPPTPACDFTYESSYVGIEISARRSSTVLGSAVIHKATGSVSACITFIDQDGGGGEPDLFECKSVPAQGSVTISSTFEHPQLSSGTYGVYVTLRGEGTAVVDSISYTLR